MSKYQVLWIDDDWAETNKQEFVNLNNTHNEIKDYFENINCIVEWTKVSNFDQAFNILTSHDIRLVILDFKFRINSDLTFDNCLKSIRERKIPYIIFTQYPEDVTLNAYFKENDNFNLAVIQKGFEGSKRLSERVKNFFKAPPFRILHLSDLHYNSKLENKYKVEQDDLFFSLLNNLDKRHKENPFDAIIISGDFASFNPDKDLVQVRSIIQELINKTITVRNLDHFFMVPGNHDINWLNFSDKILSDNPWGHFLEFYSSIFSGHFELLKEMEAWDQHKRLFNFNAMSEDLNISRTLNNPLISLIGIVTPCLSIDKQGKGYFSKKSEKFINKYWEENKPIFGEVRIAIMHHNLFSTLSVNTIDEQHILENAGDALFCLFKNNCNLVLSGHTHSPNIFLFSGHKMNFSGYRPLGDLTNIAAGTTGGISGSGDRPRAFNILEFLDAEENTGKRKLKVRPFLYESSENNWIERGACDLII